ncbi:MAG: monovalent cation/H+ antiporter subunit D family protein [Alphaproteobacteria bacterium]|nr:monovalent cation/H+ antiporter subunit D family protein [Alphaproteobacteria bacterium]
MALHLPALQVVLPLLAAPLCALVRRGTVAWAITLIASWAAFAAAIGLLLRVLDEGIISYEMGGWAPPIGIEYRVDLINVFVLLVVSGVGAVIVPYARKSIAARFGSTEQAWFYTMYLLALTGLLGVTITGDAFNIFVFLEISSLASYVMIAMGRDRRCLTAAYQYLIMGTVGATFIVIGVGLLWAMTGTLNLYDLAQRIPEIQNTRPVLAALAFLTVGISLKLALFPLHLWLPNAYAFAPSVTSAFLAGTATKVAIYLFLRFFYTVFGGEGFFVTTPLPEILLLLSLVAMFAASIVAVFQSNVKRMLAYSSVAQIGFITLGISYATETGLTGAMTHIFNHAIMKAGLFLLIGNVLYQLGSVKIEDMAGIGRKMPITMAGFVALGLSLLGTPGTVGFISKWYLGLAAVEQGQWWLVALIVIASLVTMIYIGRVVEVAYFREPTAQVSQLREAPPALLVPAFVLVGAAFYFGVETSLSVGLAQQAASLLLNAAY